MLTFNIKKFLFLSFLLISNFITEAQATCKSMGDVLCYYKGSGRFAQDTPLPPLQNRYPCKPKEISGECIYDNSISFLSEEQLQQQLDSLCNSIYPNDCISMGCVGKLKCDVQ